MLTHYVAVAFVMRVLAVSRIEAFSIIDDVIGVKVENPPQRISDNTFSWEDVWEVACARLGRPQGLHSHSGLCGYFNCADVEADPEGCYAQLVGLA